MEKTTVYLTTDQKRALARAAQATDRSEARLIREGIDAVTARHRTAEATIPLVVDDAPRRVDLTEEVAHRARWMARDEFVRRFVPLAADAALRSEFRELAPGTTNDVELR